MAFDQTVLDASVAGIVLLLIFLTIAFEFAKEHVEEAADRNMKPIISSLFGEMTVLGFLSIFTFLCTQLGFFETLSMKLFGEEEELLETFEFVHYMLFFIMVFFVISVLTLVYGAQDMEERWYTMNRSCLDSSYMERLDSIPDPNSNRSGWFSYLCQTLVPCITKCHSTREWRSELRLFRSLRQEFILERSVEPPFDPNLNPVASDFDFGRYNSICLGHTLGHIVHLNILTWGFFAVLTVVFYASMMAVENEIEVSWLTSSTLSLKC